MSNHNHLTLNDRLIIQNKLHEGRSFKFIANMLDKDSSTISKEVRIHLIIKRTGIYCSFCAYCFRNYSDYVILPQ